MGRDHLRFFLVTVSLKTSPAILMDEAKAEAIAMVKETRRIALRLHTMGVPYQDEAASLYEIAEYIERVMDVKP